MGLDAVEIVLRAEEFYSATFTDEEAAQVRTVGDFYRLICTKLNVIPLDNPATPAELPKVSDIKRSFVVLRQYTPLAPPPEVLPWTPQSVWNTTVAIIADQQCLEPEKIIYSARFVEDLGVD